MYLLKRVTDGAGDSGSMSMLIFINEQGKTEFKHDAKPEVGCQIAVGSTHARSYAEQDYWQTTEVTEIIEERDDYVKFKTRNSIYEWWRE